MSDWNKWDHNAPIQAQHTWKRWNKVMARLDAAYGFEVEGALGVFIEHSPLGSREQEIRVHVPALGSSLEPSWQDHGPATRRIREAIAAAAALLGTQAGDES